MISIPAGHIFCELYNKETGQNLTPKQIFCEVIAPIVFKPTKRESLDYWQNFCMSPTSMAKGYGCTPYAVEKFVKELEDDSLDKTMTTFKVWGGGANPLSNDGTTNCCINDNLFFTVDERYESFIGAFFRVGIGLGFTIFVNDPNVVEILWKGLKLYSDILKKNENIDGRQLASWNSIVLYEYAYRRKLDSNHIIDTYLSSLKSAKDGATHNFKTIQLPNILFALSKLCPDITSVELISTGQTNVSAGPLLLLNHTDMDSIYDLYVNLFSNVGEDFNYSDYVKLLGWGSMLPRILERGMVDNDMFDPNIDKLEDKYLIEYCKLTMNESTLDLCKRFADALAAKVKLAKHSLKVDIDRLFKSTTATAYNNTMNRLIEREGFTDDPSFEEMDILINGENPNIRQILSFTQRQYNRNKSK